MTILNLQIQLKRRKREIQQTIAIQTSNKKQHVN